MKLQQVKRTKKNRFFSWVFRKVESLKDLLKTEEGISTSLVCPHCGEVTIPDDLLEFGTLYEFCCDPCGSFFTVTVPAISIKPGKIEAML